jgi:methylase of polypeptide subunit release factors
MNNVRLDEFGEGAVSSILSYHDLATDRLVSYFKNQQVAVGLKDMEAAFELLIDGERRKLEGVFYTPNFIIDYLVENALRFANRNGNDLPRICDPSCGSGGFLIRAAEILHGRYGISPELSFTKYLTGFDKDSIAIQNANCLAELYLASKGLSPTSYPLFFVRDTLLTPPEILKNAAGADAGFDALVTNPPYVKLQNIAPEYRLLLTEKYGEFTTGNFSLALLFLIAGHRLLARGGCLAMITQNNFFTSLAGKQVRQYLQDRRCIRRIVDFGHNKIFMNASAYTCLIFLGTDKSETFDYESLSNGITGDRLNKAEFTRIKHNSLNPTKWRLAKSGHFDRLRKLESAGKPLSEIAAIKVGFATLKDSVFIVREKDGFCSSGLRGCESLRIELGAARPAVKVSDLNEQADLSKNRRRVLFPYEKVGGKYRLIPEEKFRQAFPVAFEYLLRNRDLLASRDKGRKTYEGWYAWGRTQGREAPKPKLLTKTFSKTPHFFFDDSDQLFCNGYAVIPKKLSLFDDSFPIEALARILNSRVMHYYMKLTSFQIEGDYQCYQKNFIERFRVPEMDDAQIEDLLSLPPEQVNEYVTALYGIAESELNDVLAEG